MDRRTVRCFECAGVLYDSLADELEVLALGTSKKKKPNEAWVSHSWSYFIFNIKN